MKDSILFSDVLTFWMGKQRISQAELARKLQTNSSTVSQYKNGDRTPPFEKMGEIADVFGLDILEFLACKDDTAPDIALVPLVKAVPRAGNGGLQTDDTRDGLYPFHANFLRRKQGSADTMRLFNIEGDSMEPTLANGDMIMINQSLRDIRSGFIYLIRFQGELMVKRLENQIGNIILIRSDNPAYREIEVPKNDESVDFKIFGRMVWSCREY